MQSSSDLIEWFSKVGLKEPNIIRYPEIKQSDIEIDNIDLTECNFILYEAVPRVGHWTVLFFNDVDNIIEFFDPLGYMVDDQLDFSYHKDPELLTKMVDSKEKDFEINHVKYQQAGTETCGIWCSMRYLFNCIGYSSEDFKNAFYDKIDDSSRDELIRAMFDALGLRSQITGP